MTFRSKCSYFSEQWSFKNQITTLLMKTLRACVDCILIQYMEKCFKFQMVNCFQLFKRFLVILNEFKLHLALFVITYLIGRSAGRFSHYSSDGKVRIVVYFTAAEIAEKIAEICKLNMQLKECNLTSVNLFPN